MSFFLQVPGTHVYGSEIPQAEQPNRALEVPASTVGPTSRTGQPHTYGGV
jgi:phytochrome-interacting factor 4